MAPGGAASAEAAVARGLGENLSENSNATILLGRALQASRSKSRFQVKNTFVEACASDDDEDDDSALPMIAVKSCPTPFAKEQLPVHEHGQVVPLGARTPEWSLGAALHEDQQCKPCAWFWRPQGCSNLAACRHCHLCPPGEAKARRRSKVAMLRGQAQDRTTAPQILAARAGQAALPRRSSASASDLDLRPAALPPRRVQVRNTFLECPSSGEERDELPMSAVRSCPAHVQLPCPPAAKRALAWPRPGADASSPALVHVESSASQVCFLQERRCSMSTVAGGDSPTFIDSPACATTSSKSTAWSCGYPGLELPQKTASARSMGADLGEPLRSSVKVRNTFIEGYACESEDEDGPRMTAIKSCPVRLSLEEGLSDSTPAAGQTFGHTGAAAAETASVMYVRPSPALAMSLPAPRLELRAATPAGAPGGAPSAFPRRSSAQALDASPRDGSQSPEQPPLEERPADQAEDIVPLQLRQPAWSMGSVSHALGQCRPCAWYWRPQGCINGAACRHCHLCPIGEVKARRRTKLASIRSREPGASPATASPEAAASGGRPLLLTKLV